MSIDPSSISIIYFGTDINYFTPGKTDIKKNMDLMKTLKLFIQIGVCILYMTSRP